MTRLTRHLLLALFSAVIISFLSLLLDSPDQVFVWSMGTAYVALILITITLLIGPLNIIRGQTNPVSSYLRRDIGIWAGMASLAHVVFGLQRHFGGKIWKYFLYEMNGGQSYAIRTDAFGFTNHAGLIATLIVICLLLLSNNAALKKLGKVRWKRLQQFNYLVFVLIVGHGLIYQFIASREAYMLFLGLVSMLVLVMQWKGFRAYAR